ncbi:MAG: ketopantoate reductase family protein [Planctomycetes bacterium]|nr:ketopantoate reductase family protein [Planctomycetota bacterium]
MPPTVHILGAGGIGIAAAAGLVRTGWHVTMVESNAAKVAAGERDGMCIDGASAIRVPFVPFEAWRPVPNAVVLLCTKTFDNAAVLARLPATPLLVPIQNGYDPQLDALDHPCEAIASFVSACPADRPDARITRAGALHIGARREASAMQRERMAALANAIGASGLFPVHHVDDVRPYKAAKLMYNAAISPLAAGAGVDNAELLTDPLANRLFFALLLENHAILRHAGVPLARIGPFHPDVVARILRTPLLPKLMSHFFRPSLRGTYCSMAPDMGGGRTEVDAYNGHLIRLAGQGPCPINREVVAMVQRITEGRLAPGRSHLERLAQTLGMETPA